MCRCLGACSAAVEKSLELDTRLLSAGACGGPSESATQFFGALVVLTGLRVQRSWELGKHVANSARRQYVNEKI